MALHLIRNHKFHIFIAGESYGGCLGVLAITFFTLITRSPFIGMKLTPLLFFVLFAVSLFVLGRRLFNTRIALLSITLVSLSPTLLTIMGIRERGPHPEALFLGTWLTLLTCRISQQEELSARIWFGWGALAGFCWYTHYITIFYIIPCVIFLVLNQKLLAWKSMLYAAGGTFVGSSLYWAFVLRYHILPPFDAKGIKFFDPQLGLKNFFVIGLPILTGGRWSFHHEDLVPSLSKFLVYLYLIAVILFFVWLARRPKPWSKPHFLLALQIVLCPFLFAFSSFAWFAEEPRYLMSLYASLPLLLAWCVWRTWRRSKILAATAVLIAVGVSLYGSLAIPPDVFNTIYYQSDQPLIDSLRQKGFKRFYANYWVVYRLMFETQEELVGANYFDITYERYPQFKRIVDQDPKPAYVAWESEAPGFEQTLRQSQRSYTKERVGRYVVFYNIEPRLPPR